MAITFLFKCRSIYKLREDIAGVEGENGFMWPEVCKRRPSSFPLSNKDKLEPCWESHLFEIWANNGEFTDGTRAKIEALEDSDVLDVINAKSIKSNLTGSLLLPEKYLGTVERDQEGNIVSAKAMIMYFKTKKAKIGSSRHTKVRNFEGNFIDLVNDVDLGSKLECFPNAFRSMDDLINVHFVSDGRLFRIGYALVCLYVMVMLGKWNRVETAVILAFCGMFSISIGLLSAFGLCSHMGLISMTIVEELIILLACGIGIDDIFGMIHSIGNAQGDLDKRVGLFMRQAGMALTMTSLLEIVAFAAGVYTDLVFIQHFSFFCIVSIFFMSFFMLTFFLGCIVLEQRRMMSRRYALLCCLKADTQTSLGQCSGETFLTIVFSAYGKFLTHKVGKAIFLIATSLLLVASLYGFSLFELDYEVDSSYKSGTYLRDYYDRSKSFLAENGIEGAVYLVNVTDVSSKMNVVKRMRRELGEMELLSGHSGRGGFDEAFEMFVHDSNSTHDAYPEGLIGNKAFYRKLSKFLCSSGRPYLMEVDFDTEFDPCGQNLASNISVLSLPYQHKK